MCPDQYELIIEKQSLQEARFQVPRWYVTEEPVDTSLALGAADLRVLSYEV